MFFRYLRNALWPLTRYSPREDQDEEGNAAAWAMYEDMREFWMWRKYVDVVCQERYFAVQRLFEYYERPLTEAELWFLT